MKTLRIYVILVTALATVVCAAQEGPLVLAQDGQALARIVAPTDTSVPAWAARELKTYLDQVTGAEFEIVTAADMSPRIFVGDCPEARAAGFDVADLQRDGSWRAVVGDDLYLLGRDEPGPVKIYVHNLIERGSFYAVDHFLEDVCGVRFIKGGPYGDVIPSMPSVTVERTTVRDEPFFVDRSLGQSGLHGYDYPDADAHATLDESGRREDDRQMLLVRSGWGTLKMATGCHSSHYLMFDERFAEEHPEWFVLLPNGERGTDMPRGSYLCYSHPGVVQAFIDDARAYFGGEPPESRELTTWNKCGYGDEFMVDPHDSYPYCQCEDCQRVYQADPDQSFSEIIFGAVAKVANAVSDFEGKYISTLAYGPKRQPPKTVTLPENVRVRLCVNGPLYHSMAGTRDEQLDLIRRWSERMEGDLVLWLYINQARPTKPIAGVPQVEAHAIADFLRAVKPYVRGAYFENESTAQTFRFLDEYVVLKMLWDPDQDVDALLDDYFTSFYGPGGEPIKAIYARLEELWRKVYTIYGGDMPRFASRVDLWEKIYTEEELAAMDVLIAEAKELAAGDEAYAWRVGMFGDEMVGRLHANRDDYERTLGVASQSEVTCYRASAEPDADGLLPMSAWDGVPHEVLGPAMETEKLHVLTHVKVAWTPEALHLLIECEEPDPDADPTLPDRQADDADLWKDQTIEYMVTVEDDRIMSQSQYHAFININGVVSDLQKALGESDYAWQGQQLVTIERDESRWTARITAPFAAMGIGVPIALGRASFNVVRHRPRVGQAPEYYAWSPASQQGGWTEATLHGQIIFAPDVAPTPQVNLLKNGALDPARDDGRWFADWLVPTANVDNIFRDEEIRWDGAAAARLHADEVETVTLLQYLEGIQPATTYRFSCKVRTEEIVGEVPGHNGAYVNFNAPGFNQFVPQQALTGTSDWRNIAFEVTTAPADKWPEGARPYIRLKIGECTGTAWFDEAQLIEVTE